MDTAEPKGPATATPPITPADRRRAILAGGSGNVVEWFDWTTYALFATYFSQEFFPAADELTSLLATFAVFAVGFFARPFGSVLFGRTSDRRGRKAALTTAILVMAACSVGIALLPTYAQVGLAAPLLLLALRIVQGLSLGGETAAIGAFLVESAPPGRRGRFGSVYAATIMVGSLLGSLTGLALTSTLSSAQMDAYGWRIPFVIGGALGLAGFFIRRHAREPFHPSDPPEPAPIRRTLAERRGPAALVFVLVGAGGLTFFGLVAGFPALAKYYGVADNTAFAANTAGLVAIAVLAPLLGGLSDRVGRKPIGLLGLFGLAVVTVPAIGLLRLGDALAAELLIAVPLAAVQGIMMVALVERFPARLRGTGFGSVWALAVALVGGTGPLIATWLQSTNRAGLFAWYVAGWCLLAGAAMLASRETAFAPLPDDR